MNSELRRFWLPGPLIVGAGPSGLAVAACLSQRGVPFLILEKENCLASLWKLRTYDCLKLHLPKKFCQLPHMSFPREFPTYPTKQQFVTYLEAYAKHFSIHPIFGNEVKSASYNAANGLWRVVANGSEYFCRWLIIATGDNAAPEVPEIDGLPDFEGKAMHTSEYKNGAEFRGRTVLVVGCGNSGMEISLNLCDNGAKVSLVVRHKVHILPREILDTSRFGIARPQVGPLELKKTTGKTPVLDVGSFAKIKSGEIKVVGEIRRFTSRGVEFMDGKVEEFDSIILATGYKSNVASWLKDDIFVGKGEGNGSNGSCIGDMKGKNGIYSIGFTGQGLLGTSVDAERAAEDIARQWNSSTKHPNSKLVLNP